MTCDYSKYKIAFIGGDQRAVYAAQRLAGKGIESALFGFDQYKGDIGLCTKCDTVEDAATLADILVLPIPMTCDGITVCAPFCSKCLLLDEVLKSVSGDTAVLYGGGCFKIENMSLCVTKMYSTMPRALTFRRQTPYRRQKRP